MAKYDIKLRPIHYACVSGGKDSLYMLNLILNNLDKYPLDMVVHYEMEIDWEWTKEVVDFIEQRCNQAGLKFVRIKPEHDWNYWYLKYGFPTRQKRWCNSHLKMNCANQIVQWIKGQDCRPIAYIGFCADESNRFKYTIGEWENQDVCYPLAEEGIEEWQILEWAKKTPIFHDWYKYFNRQGCMLCPCLSMKEKAYMFKYYPQKYAEYMQYAKHWEERPDVSTDYFGEPLEIHKKRIETKWLEILNSEEQFEQLSIYDFVSVS